MDRSPSEQTLLGIYLNDHLAGSTGGADLARRLARTEGQWAGNGVLDQLATEIEDDRQALLRIMAALDVPVRLYKAWAAWAAEKIGRLKLNGTLLTRSPLSRLVELEMMRLGVEGKAAGWRTLRERAESDARLDRAQLDELLDRAHRQVDKLETLRVRAAAETLR
jgi:hypothetical protein